MSPRAQAKQVMVALVKVSPETERAIREGVEAIQRGESRTLSREELDRWGGDG
jgi:hypothetical protein